MAMPLNEGDSATMPVDEEPAPAAGPCAPRPHKRKFRFESI